YPDMRGLGQGVMGLHEDSHRNLWVGLGTGVWRWKPGPPEFFSIPGQPDGIHAMAEDEDGALLIGIEGGVSRLVDGRVQMAYPLPPTIKDFTPHTLLRDRDGGLWARTALGIVHVHQGRTDLFSQSDGLSGDSVARVFEDREGNIWVSTANGLDRFRELPVVTYSKNQGLPSVPRGTVLGARDGSIWIPTIDGLDRLNNGQLTVYRQRGARPTPGVREIVGSGLPDHGLGSLFQDSRGRIW